MASEPKPGSSRQGSRPYEHISQTPSPVVVRLVEPISGNNRNITYDNWFSSIALSNDILQNQISPQLEQSGKTRKRYLHNF